MTNVQCVGCSREIEPGQRRQPTVDGPIHDLCQLREDVAERYTFYVSNPENKEPVAYSVFIDEGDREYPIVYNTSGLNLFASSRKGWGDGIPVTTEFVDSVAYGYHECMAFMGYDMKRLDNLMKTFYGDEAPYQNKVPGQDRWAVHNIVQQLWFGDTVPKEFGPLLDYTDEITDFGVPDVTE